MGRGPTASKFQLLNHCFCPFLLEFLFLSPKPKCGSRICVERREDIQTGYRSDSVEELADLHSNQSPKLEIFRTGRAVSTSTTTSTHNQYVYIRVRRSLLQSIPTGSVNPTFWAPVPVQRQNTRNQAICWFYSRLGCPSDLCPYSGWSWSIVYPYDRHTRGLV